MLKKQNELNVLKAVMEGEEKERLRLARELHDGVGGILSASKMHVSLIRDDERGTPQASSLQNIVSMLDQASQEIRTIAHNLSPDILSTYELDVALAHYCDRISNEEFVIEYYFLGEMPKLNDQFKVVVYRACQELINNVIKHAKADHVIVQLSQHDSVLSLTVEDNGIGFNHEDSHGIGLANLRSRVREMNGQLNINSAPGSGTTVQLEFNITNFIKTPLLEATPV